MWAGAAGGAGRAQAATTRAARGSFVFGLNGCLVLPVCNLSLLGVCQAFKANKAHMKAAQKRKAKLVKAQSGLFLPVDGTMYVLSEIYPKVLTIY